MSKINSSTFWGFLTAITTAGIMIGFQNCSKTGFGTQSDETMESTFASVTGGFSNIKTADAFTSAVLTEQGASSVPPLDRSAPQYGEVVSFRIFQNDVNGLRSVQLSKDKVPTFEFNPKLQIGVDLSALSIDVFEAPSRQQLEICTYSFTSVTEAGMINSEHSCKELFFQDREHFRARPFLFTADRAIFDSVLRIKLRISGFDHDFSVRFVKKDFAVQPPPPPAELSGHFYFFGIEKDGQVFLKFKSSERELSFDAITAFAKSDESKYVSIAGADLNRISGVLFGGSRTAFSFSELRMSKLSWAYVQAPALDPAFSFLIAHPEFIKTLSFDSQSGDTKESRLPAYCTVDNTTVFCEARIEGDIQSGYWTVNDVKQDRSENLVQFTWSNVPDGSYTIQPVGFTSQGVKVFGSRLQVTVKNERAPVVGNTIQITCPHSAAAGQTVTCSADIRGSFASGYWLVDGYKQGGSDNLSQFSWFNVPDGIYVVVAHAFDSSGNKIESNRQVVTITPSSPPNPGPSSILISCPNQLRAGESASCNANVLGFVQSGYWTVNGQKQEGSDNLTTFTWHNIQAGTYTVQGIGYDQNGHKIESNRVVVSVLMDPPPLAAGLVIECPPGAVEKTSVTCNANLLGVKFSSGYWSVNGQKQEGSDNLTSFTWTNVPAGLYEVQAVAYANGQEVRSNKASVLVHPDHTPPPPMPPSALRIQCPTRLAAGANGTCSAELVGDIKSGYWNVNGQKQLGSEDKISYTWTSIPAGEYRIQAVGFSSSGAKILSNEILVTVGAN